MSESMIAFLQLFSWLLLLFLPIHLSMWCVMATRSSSWGARNTTAREALTLVGLAVCAWWVGWRPFEVLLAGMLP